MAPKKPAASAPSSEPEITTITPSPGFPIDFGTGPAPEDIFKDGEETDFLSTVDPDSLLPPLPSASSDTEKVNEVLGGMSFPISEEHVKSFRLDLADLTIEEQVDLAREAHNTIGKASGYLPDFNSQTENMKSAYMKIVREIWIAAQRKARTFDE